MQDFEPLRDATGVTTDALRAQARDDGYLFVPGLVPPDAVASLRAAVLSACEHHEWLDDVRVRPGARLTGAGYDDPRWVDLQCRVLADPRFVAVGDHPRVLSLMASLYGEAPRTRLGDLCRLALPGQEALTTPPHQDHWYVRGTTDMWTCWVPLVDVPLELGPLAVAPGSHALGLLRHAGPEGGYRAQGVPPETRWATGSLEAGDALLFNALTLHRALPNRTADRARLSVDYRYAPLTR